jgi:flagellar L-ring protein FlgH
MKKYRSVTTCWLLYLFAGLGLVNGESLYSEEAYQSLVSDRKAYKVGDLLTVLVIETARAESRAGTGSEKNTGIRASAMDSISSHEAGLALGVASGGDAVTSRHGFISAQLAVRVISIDESGLLNVSGEQSIVINGEEQKIVISGSLRKEDVNKDNTIISSRLTNAHIEFSGDGVVNDAQDTSIFYKILQWLGIS